MLETYRTLLAWRQSNEALLSGRTKFLDTAEPILAFLRGDGHTALVCLFNLSPTPVTLTLTGAALTGPSQNASLDAKTLTLGPNAYAFARPTGTLTLTA